MNRIEQYLFLEKNADLNDKLIFSAFLIEGMDILNLSENAAASLIDVSVPSIRRWKNGQAPSMVFRKFAIRKIKEKIEEELNGTD